MIVKKTVPDSILEELSRMMNSGEIHEGEKFPNQNALSQQLGVSRSSLREALHTLTLLGVINQKPGVGMVLKTRLPLMLMDNLSLSVLPEKNFCEELLEVRRLLESDMVPRAVTRATDKEIKDLEAICKRMERQANLEKIDAYIQLDLKFHSILAQMGHNRFYHFVFTCLHQHFSEFLSSSFRFTDILLTNSVNGHRAILNAAKARDVEKATEAIEVHLAQVEKAIKNFFNRQVMAG